MIKEQARIVGIESDWLWAETMRKSVCGSCVAQAGCGQSLLSKWTGHATYIKALVEQGDRTIYKVGDKVLIGIPEFVVVRGSLFVYMTPILGLLAGAVLGHYVGGTEGVAIAGALIGFSLAAVLVRWHSYWRRRDRRQQPMVLQRIQSENRECGD